MNRRAHGHGFIRVYVFTWLFTEEFFDLLLHLGHARHAAHQDHILNIAYCHASVFNRSAARGNRALDELFDQSFQLGARELHVQVLWAACINGDVGQVDLGLLARRQLNLGFFSDIFQAL